MSLREEHEEKKGLEIVLQMRHRRIFMKEYVSYLHVKGKSSYVELVDLEMSQ